jgi:hypothetical protein
MLGVDRPPSFDGANDVLLAKGFDRRSLRVAETERNLSQEQFARRGAAGDQRQTRS